MNDSWLNDLEESIVIIIGGYLVAVKQQFGSGDQSKKVTVA